jgi:L-alanine-DL-glutamate epimerase-like enolase superfamily enzyme
VRVTGLELFAVPPRWLFLKLSTDEGIAGWGEPIVDGRVATVRAARDGHIAVPDGPGLGVEIDEERVREAAGAAPWHSPVWRNQDGTVAEW